MAALIIAPIPEALFEKLKKSAAEHRKSLEDEARALLEKGLAVGATEAALGRESVRELRRSFDGKITPLSDEILAQARNERRS